MQRKTTKQSLTPKQRLNVRKAYAMVSPMACVPVVSLKGVMIGIASFDGTFRTVMERKLPA